MPKFINSIICEQKKKRSFFFKCTARSIGTTRPTTLLLKKFYMGPLKAQVLEYLPYCPIFTLALHTFVYYTFIAFIANFISTEREIFIFIYPFFTKERFDYTQRIEKKKTKKANSKNLMTPNRILYIHSFFLIGTLHFHEDHVFFTKKDKLCKLVACSFDFKYIFIFRRTRRPNFYHLARNYITGP